jgi:hypothetical protein
MVGDFDARITHRVRAALIERPVDSRSGVMPVEPRVL